MNFDLRYNEKIDGSISFTLEYNGYSYLMIYGKYINGWYLCIPSKNLSFDLASPRDNAWNMESLCKVLDEEFATVILQAIHLMHSVRKIAATMELSEMELDTEQYNKLIDIKLGKTTAEAEIQKILSKNK